MQIFFKFYVFFKANMWILFDFNFFRKCADYFDFQIMATCGWVAKHVKPHYSFPILPSHTLTQTNTYIHLNPDSCGFLRLHKSFSFWWSKLSHASYCFGVFLLQCHKIFSLNFEGVFSIFYEFPSCRWLLVPILALISQPSRLVFV